MHVTVVVRQLVLPRPPRDLFRFPIRPPVAVLLAAISLLKESLVLGLQLVVEDDAPNPATLVAEAFLRALVCPIDLRVVREFVWLLRCFSSLSALKIAQNSANEHHQAPHPGHPFHAFVHRHR